MRLGRVACRELIADARHGTALLGLVQLVALGREHEHGPRRGHEHVEDREVERLQAVARIGEVGLVGFGGGALVLGYGALALAPSLSLATAALVVLGIGFYALHTTVQTHATQMAPGARGAALALFASFLFLGQAAGVWLAGRLADAAGLPAMFAVAAGSVLVLTLLLRRALVRHRA